VFSFNGGAGFRLPHPRSVVLTVKKSCPTRGRVLLLLGVALFMILRSGPGVYAETYLAGEAGLTVPQSLQNIRVTSGPNSGAKATADDLKNSAVLGGKLGYFFERIPWLGLELEGFGTTPHFEQQSRVATLPNGATVAQAQRGANLRVLTWATNVVARAQWDRLTPYVAIGPGVFVARRKTPQTDNADTSTTLGLNTQVGLGFQLTRAFALFGEWKYNYSHFHFDQVQNPQGSQVMQAFRGTYTAHLFVFGVAYHFN
jgi:outer membrane protein with beta-barrel domain